MPRKKGVSLKRNCLQRSATDDMDLLDKDVAQHEAHQGKVDDNDFPMVAVASPEAGGHEESSSLGEKDKLMFMAQAIKALEEERDFLRQTVLKLSNRGAKKKVKKILDSSTECSTSGTDEESLSSCSSLESSDSDIPRKKKRGHKKKTKSSTRSNTKHSSRATTPEDVLKRYNKVFHAFKKEGSISKACTKVGVDRNTLALTAVVAEIQLVDPEFYRSIPKFRLKDEKLCDFAKRCLQSMTADLKSTIENAKKERKLLPITYKLR
ncbi:coiled-coil domain-containing protein 106-like isoform X2 [Pimephales promelas]|uniref:coiled-coil domain-containing protein 106-like isoform X2 n=1 Tax=Pimephales promelas TaxID=90988 RepID=UPI0019557CEF|nr:coiled-coil domain-containing protein 106-like isoform X2 [Pimephales promelas]KAG1954693.1 coiled-coil domain-containing protein [Pimephales promelas]KAG1954694.1 coiled-coil domain-containing protein [Pimephales promelas]